MRGAVALVLALLAAGCAEKQQQGEPRPVQTNEPASPVLLRYLPPERGGPSVFPEAQVSGVLDLSGPCVRLHDSGGRMTTLVSSSGPYLGRDVAGLFIQTGTDRLRHGSSVTGGGGWFDVLPTLGHLDRPLPEECRSGPFVVLTGMEGYDPADQPPPRSPPPPPVR